MSLAFRIGAPLLKAQCVARARRFRAALASPRAAQEAVADRAIGFLAATAYGRACSLSSADGVAEFRAKVPIVGYAELEPWLARQRREGGAVLTSSPVRWWETTSGSGGPRKPVPYTPALLGAFAGMFRIWADDLLSHGPGFASGRLAASVSPQLRAGGVADDGAYLPELLRRLLRPFLVWPPTLARLREAEAFRDVAAALLLAEEELEIISVWSPTFLLVLLDHLASHGERLAEELQNGRLQREGLTFDPKPVSAARRKLIARPSADWHLLWPHLKLLSCWTAGAAGMPARRLAGLFPGVLLQGKGLLATEAPVTVPLLGAPSPVPLADEVVIEVLMPNGDLRQLHELSEGDAGELVVTVPGGLPRYRLGDRVCADGRLAATPCLRFVGRAGEVADLAGEKLDGAFVASVLADLLPPEAGCAILLPWWRRGAQGYLLVVDTDSPDLAARADAALAAAFHYRQARQLGQLLPLQAIVRVDLKLRLQSFFLARGMVAGDIKERALVADPALTADLLAWVQPDTAAAQASADSGANRP